MSDIKCLRALCNRRQPVRCLYSRVPAGDHRRTGGNNSCQQALLCLAFCGHVFYVFSDRMDRRTRGFSLSLRKFLRATTVHTGRTGQNNSCQQASLPLASCMHVLSVSPDRMARRAIGLWLSLFTQGPAADHGHVSGSISSLSRCLRIVLCRWHAWHIMVGGVLHSYCMQWDTELALWFKCTGIVK